MHPFRQAVESRDEAAIEALLAEDVVFTSPVAFKPYPGKAITAAILRGVMRVFEDFHYVREIGSPDGRDHAFLFRAKVDGREVHGCDFLHFDEEGKIDDFLVMVRPLSGAKALAEASPRRPHAAPASAACAASASSRATSTPRRKPDSACRTPRSATPPPASPTPSPTSNSTCDPHPGRGPHRRTWPEKDWTGWGAGL